MKNIVLLGCIAIYSAHAVALDFSYDNPQTGQSISVNGGAVSVNNAGNKVNAGSQSANNGGIKFNKLRLDVNANVHVHLGDQVNIDLGENQAAVSVQTSMGTLTLSSGARPVNDASSINVYAQTLDTVVLDSASDIEFDNVQQQKLEIILNGAGNIRISGHVANLVATINGSGDLELDHLVAETASVRIAGSGTANVNVTRELQAEISGAGDVRYLGNPRIGKPKITGAGSVERMRDEKDKNKEQDDEDEEDE